MRRRTFLGAAALAGAAPARTILAGFGRLRFPGSFVWGVSTSAFQIEGGLTADGRGPSIWDSVADKSASVVDHYRRWREDVASIARLGVGAYRFSVAWPRVLPDGTGAVNAPGLDFYDRLVDRLLHLGVTPVLCLYHWDLPVALQHRGGWLDRGVVDAFARYAAVVAGRLGDRVRYWIPINEALSIAFGGYGIGIYPPFVKDETAYFRAAHHLNLAQGAGFAALRAPGRKLGTAMCLYPVRPATPSAADAAAARYREAMSTRLFLDPLLRGAYPTLVEARVAPHLRGGDLTLIRQPVDFIGVNYYTPDHQRAAPGMPFGTTRADPRGLPRTGNGWSIEPDGLYDQLIELRDRYGNPAVYITENGAAFDDPVGADGQIDDAPRIAFLRAHLAAAHRALGDGVDLRGYFVWSLLDNYEWLVGFKARFGLVRVDAGTGARLPKRSFDWYRAVARSGIA